MKRGSSLPTLYMYPQEILDLQLDRLLPHEKGVTLVTRLMVETQIRRKKTFLMNHCPHILGIKLPNSLNKLFKI